VRVFVCVCVGAHTEAIGTDGANTLTLGTRGTLIFMTKGKRDAKKKTAKCWRKQWKVVVSPLAGRRLNALSTPTF